MNQTKTRTSFSGHRPFLVPNERGLPELVVAVAGRYVTVATFEERTLTGDDGNEEAWANARHILALLTGDTEASAERKRNLARIQRTHGIERQWGKVDWAREVFDELGADALSDTAIAKIADVQEANPQGY